MAEETKAPRKRGRPKGSTNKKVTKSVKAKNGNGNDSVTPKRRGRPKKAKVADGFDPSTLSLPQIIQTVEYAKSLQVTLGHALE